MHTFTALRDLKEQEARSTANNLEEARLENVDLNDQLNSEVGQAFSDRLKEVGKPKKPFVGI
jgi:hypothetical protein